MKILAIETATEACSAALLCDGKVLEKYEHQPQRQAHLILPMVDMLLADAGIQTTQLDAIAFGCGPGSFTGLRIAAAVTQGIAVVNDLPVLPVSTLAAIAQGIYRRHKADAVLAAIDARMQEIYWGAYRLNAQGLMELSGEEQVLPPDTVSAPDIKCEWQGAGSGWDVYRSVLEARLSVQDCKVQTIYEGIWPSAVDILTLAVPLYEAGKSVAQAMPVYLRDKVARSIRERNAEKE